MIIDNDLPPIIVQKFGGTTVQHKDAFPEIARLIRRELDMGNKVVAVVSAMGRGPDSRTSSAGDPYATDTLLNLLPSDASYVCLREKDLIMMCGEIISAVTLACHLRATGIIARARTGFEAGIVTDENSGNARIREVLPYRILADLHVMDVVVVAGFQGSSPTGKITTLGRGGSDTSAIAIGKALGAERIDIFTDQTGVFSADPREVPNAQYLKTINAKDIVHMSWAGAKVLHPRAAELLDRQHLNVRIGSIRTPEKSTTIEVSDGYESSQLVTAVAHGDNVVQFSVNHDSTASQQFLAILFEAVSDISVSMDMFTITENLIRFTVEETQSYAVINLLDRLEVNYFLRSGCRKVSIVGAGMHKMKGVMARFTRSLVEAGIPILQTTDSHATISALVPGQMSESAQQALHKEFIEN